MKSELKQKILGSRLGYALRIMSHVYRLPRYIASLEADGANLSRKVAKNEETVNDLTTTVSETKNSLQKHDSRLTDLNHKILTMDHKQSSPKTKDKTNDTPSLADDHLLDNFYIDFEDKHRGTEEDIKKRLSFYLKYFNEVKEVDKGLPILDLGCGRGEFLSVLKDNGFNGVGIDLNKSMVERAKSRGFEAEEDDALSYLMKQKSNSVFAVTGFHLVEHLPFGLLVRLFEECYRVVAPGGFVLFETPNPENITVGACNFYMDPSHLSPIPPALLSFTLDTRGFSTDIVRVHPVKENITHTDDLVQDMAVHFYGARDYAALGYKH